MLKRYEEASDEQRVNDVFDDIRPVSNLGGNRLGTRRRSPLLCAIGSSKASSNEGDIVLDPFCGCATACVSAKSLGRQWTGIDLSPVATTLVESRLGGQFGIFSEIHHRTDVPRRTDLGEVPNYRTHKHELFGKQEAHCRGCEIAFPSATSGWTTWCPK